VIGPLYSGEPGLRSRQGDYRRAGPEVQRKIGQMLLATERAKGVRLDGKTKGNIGGNVVLPPKNEPTLATLGISKRESVEAQMLAAVCAT